MPHMGTFMPHMIRFMEYATLDDTALVALVNTFAIEYNEICMTNVAELVPYINAIHEYWTIGVERLETRHDHNWIVEHCVCTILGNG